MTSLAQRTWSAFSAEDRAERRALGGITLKMYDDAFGACLLGEEQ